jgi:hypothetical protein
MGNTNHTISLITKKKGGDGEDTTLTGNEKKPFIIPNVSAPISVGSLSLAASPLQIDSGGDAGGDGVNPGNRDGED